MDRYFKRFIFIFVFLTIYSFSIFSEEIKEGSIAPDFEVALIDGKTQKLSDITKSGKAVLLHFWATWCSPCVKELPEMNKLALKLQGQGSSSKLAFFAVCVSDSKKNCLNFLSKNKYTFTCGIDEDGSVADLYGVEGIPTSILITPDGKIQKMNVGMMTASQLSNFTSAYIK